MNTYDSGKKKKKNRDVNMIKWMAERKEKWWRREWKRGDKRRMMWTRLIKNRDANNK